MFVRTLASLMMLLLTTAQLRATEATPVSLDLHEVEAKLIAKTNEMRARNGLHPLAISDSLMQSARRHTAWMCNTYTFAHGNAGVPENIAMGQHSVDSAISSWMNSPGHRANMLSGSYSQIGVAAYRANNGTIYWCQQFLR
jgi:uncharacterized protein YkwD